MVVAVLCAAHFARPAAGREGAPVTGVLIERMVTAMLTVHGDARPPSVTELTGFERRVDPSGRTISEGSFDVPAAADLEPIGRFGCSGQGDEPGFRDHSEPVPVRLDADVGGTSARSVFHIYSLDRERSPGQRTLQVLICAAGGSRAADGQRLLQAGIGAYFDDQDETHIIGKKWLYGPTPAHGEQGYGFDDDSGATGSIDQDPSGELEGSFLGPFPSPFNDYFRNAVAGWWEHPCLDGDMCRPADGSTVFQGSLAGALWEFHDDPGADRRFRVALFFAVSCADPSACP